MTEALPSRYLRAGERAARVPVNVVWEITLACDLACQHCGSRAGRRRRDELTTAECMDVVAQMACMGVRDVALIGGEAYLRKDWLQIVRAIRDAGMECGLQSGGRNLDEKRLTEAAAAGLQGVGISIDGLPELHDELRGVSGSYERALRALRLVPTLGMISSVNTQINARSLSQLPAIMDIIVDAGATNWQLAITVAMGNAADHAALLLQPWQMLDVLPMLRRLSEEGRERGLVVQLANNIGYFGPHESFVRNGFNEEIHWQGCSAGNNLMGIEADGTIKACPGLPSPYAGGNLRLSDMREIWDHGEGLAFTRKRTVDDLWGYCRTCYYAETCMAGCTWTAHSLFGRPGNNPMCHYRAADFRARGLRERLVKVAEAPGRPFDHGLFEIVVEADRDADGRTRDRILVGE